MDNVQLSNYYMKILRDKILADATSIKITVSDKTVTVPITSKYAEDGTDGSYKLNLSYKLTSNLNLGTFNSMQLTLVDALKNDITNVYMQTLSSEVNLTNAGTIILMNWVIDLSSLASSQGGN